MTGRGEAVTGASGAAPTGLPTLRAGPDAMAAALDRVAREDAAVLPLLAPGMPCP